MWVIRQPHTTHVDVLSIIIFLTSPWRAERGGNKVRTSTTERGHGIARRCQPPECLWLDCESRKSLRSCNSLHIILPKCIDRRSARRRKTIATMKEERDSRKATATMEQERHHVASVVLKWVNPSCVKHFASSLLASFAYMPPKSLRLSTSVIIWWSMVAVGGWWSSIWGELQRGLLLLEG